MFFRLSYHILISIYVLLYRMVIFFVVRKDKEKFSKYENRLGKISAEKKTLLKTFKKPFWIHAVSGGEVKLASTLIKEYLFKEQVVITYMSDSAAHLANRLFSQSKNLVHFFLPLDAKTFMNSIVSLIDPRKFFVIEHDAWPNLLASLKKHQTPRIMLNYHLKPSDNFFFSLLPSVFRFTHLFETFLTQDDKTLQQIQQFKPLFKPENIGNLKYRFSFSKSDFKPNFNRKIIVLGSSHHPEEIIVVEKLLPLLKQKRMILIIAPRHLERCRNISKQIEKKFKLKTTLVNHLLELKEASEVVLFNQFGSLSSLYQLSDINLIGDTFIKSNGGHNILESIYLKKTTFYGKYLINFREITNELEEKVFADFRLTNDKITSLVELMLNDERLKQEITQKAFEIAIKFQYDERRLRKIIFE